jgi:branched-chain amino acid transport system substrate-binding protein
VLAIEEANRRGLPGGFRLRLDDLDDTVQGKHDPAQGAQNVKDFVADPAIVASLGPMNSNVAEAEIPIGNAAGLAEITMAASASVLTHAPDALKLRIAQPNRPAFFRVCASDDRQGAAAAAFARSMGLERAFVIDDDESYGKGIADEFASAFARAGGAIAGREHLTAFALDLRPLLTKVKAVGPDMVFFGGIVSTGGAVLRRQMPDVGLGQVPYFGGDGLVSPEYVPLAGPAAEGTYFTTLAPDIDHFPDAHDFAAAYRARFGTPPGSYSPGGYAAASVAIEAIRRSLAAHPRALPSRGEVLRRIAATSGLVTPIGAVSFDPSGDLRKPVISLYRIRGGRVEFVRQAGG